jgi:two-component system, cell cycle sensor histidine kinase and response regulator CckA
MPSPLDRPPDVALSPRSPPSTGGATAVSPAAMALSIVEQLPDIVLRYDLEGRILFVNEAIRTVTGRGPEHYLGRLATEVSPTPETSARFAAARDEVLATGEPVTFEVHRPWSEPARSIEYRMLPERDARGRIHALIAVGRDVTAARRAAEALRASEARYRALAEATSQVVWVAGPAGEVGDALDGWLSYTGQHADASRRRGDEWLEAVHPDDRARAAEAWARALRTASVYESRYRLRRHDGAWRTVVARAAPVRGGDGRIVEWIGTITDVTEHAEASAALEAERARLLEAQRIARMGSWSWTRESGRVFVSEEWLRIAGAGPDAAQDPEATLGRLVAPEERARFDERVALIDRERPAATEGRWRVVRADGEERVVHTRSRWQYDAEGRRVAGSGTYQDVTEQVAAEQRLARQQALLEESQRLAHVGSWELDLATDAITWSDEMYRIAGLTPADGPVSRERVAAVIADDDRPYVRARLAEGIATGAPVEYEHRIVRPDREVRTVQTRARMVPGPDGATARVVGSTQDVTERRELETQVSQSQKMEALGLLAGSVAHDFNNLLSAILGGAELARLEAPDGSALATDLDDIRRAAQRAAELTRQLLAFSRKQPRRPRVMDLRDPVRQAERLLRRLVPDEVALDVVIGAEPCVVLADAGQLEQVMVNLVVNARDAILDARGEQAARLAARADGAAVDGLVTVEVGVRAVAAGETHLGARNGTPLPAGPYAALTVRDNGVGMDAATRARIFEPFFTTKPEGEGTGLGLATVFGVVAQHDGAIDVASDAGAGAAFTILLPVVDAPLDQAHLGVARAPRGAETILLVEDESAVRATATRILERNGYRVVAARHGADAVLAWEEYGGAIDAVVTDLRMPAMGGRALVEWLRAERPSLPLVLMSGYTSGKNAAEAAMLEREVFLEKPFTAESLLVHVRAALDSPRA